MEALAPKYRRIPNLKNRVADEVEEVVLDIIQGKSALWEKENRPDFEGAGDLNLTEHR